MTIDAPNSASTLRLVWPQWQGAGAATVAALLPDVEIDRARRAYSVGTRVLQAVLPEHAGPTRVVPVDGGDPDEGSTGGVESRSAIRAGLRAALEAIESCPGAERICTLGGECSVSVAPFTSLAARYGDDLAVVWIDAHPDVDTPDTGYDGWHAMAVSAILGRGDPELVGMLPATVDASRVALVGLHDWVEDAYAHVGEWGLSSFAPDDLREDSRPLLDWLASTGASRLAIHLDVDVVDSDEVVLGLGQVPGGLTSTQVRRVIDDLSGAADVVGLTVAEFIPLSVLRLQTMLAGLPLL
ncbi:arginase family protein [Propionibacterium australiense]|uniref:Arginase family protein n=2 Tax=Propionibacterium australiense TaxID=119981 RepID=A0A8B3FPM9_9ACTN|nr:arginase family protein [Propionibacterium australiense]